MILYINIPIKYCLLYGAKYDHPDPNLTHISHMSFAVFAVFFSTLEMHQEKPTSNSPDEGTAERLRDFYTKSQWCTAEIIVVKTSHD